MPQSLDCRLLLIQPSRLSREGLRAILRDVTSSVADAGSALAFVKGKGPIRPDIVIWGSGIPAKFLRGEIAVIRNRFDPAPEPIKHIVLASDIGPSLVRQVVALDVDALLHDDITGSILLRYIDLVLLGQRVFPVSSHRQVSSHAEIVPFPGRQNRPAPVPERAPELALTRREAAILRHIAEGLSNKRIAAALNSAEGSVKVHVRALLRKIGVANRTQAATWAMNNVPEIVDEHPTTAARTSEPSRWPA